MTNDNNSTKWKQRLANHADVRLEIRNIIVLLSWDSDTVHIIVLLIREAAKKRGGVKGLATKKKTVFWSSEEKKNLKKCGH